MEGRGRSGGKVEPCLGLRKQQSLLSCVSTSVPFRFILPEDFADVQGVPIPRLSAESYLRERYALEALRQLEGPSMAENVLLRLLEERATEWDQGEVRPSHYFLSIFLFSFLLICRGCR